MLDLEDAPIVHPHNFGLLDRAILCFKRELPADRARAFMKMRAPALPTELERVKLPLSTWMAKLRPISIGVSATVLTEAAVESQKTTDIFFAGQIVGSSTVRQTGIVELNRLAQRGVKVDVLDARLELKEFLRRAAQARMVWSPEGLAHDCFRHYEAAVCRSVPLINSPGIERYKPLLQNVHALYYAPEPGGLMRTALWALREPHHLQAMGRAAQRHVVRNHSHPALSQYVLSETAIVLGKHLPRSLGRGLAC
jgi:hypothetical protein